MAYFEGNVMTGGYGNGPDIINSCTVNVNKGEIVSILGPNGAGKSTAMKAMLGLLKLKSGSVIIDGKDISKLSPQDRVKEDTTNGIQDVRAQISANAVAWDVAEMELSAMFQELYLVVALILGLGFLYFSIKLYRDDTNASAMQTFAYSISYLAALFGAMLVDQYLYL